MMWVLPVQLGCMEFFTDRKKANKVEFKHVNFLQSNGATHVHRQIKEKNLIIVKPIYPIANFI